MKFGLLRDHIVIYVNLKFHAKILKSGGVGANVDWSKYNIEIVKSNIILIIAFPQILFTAAHVILSDHTCFSLAKLSTTRMNASFVITASWLLSQVLRHTMGWKNP